MDVKYRWIGNDASQEERDLIEGIMSARGWMSINWATPVRIRVAEDEQGNLLGFYILQLVPHAEPLFVKPSARASGIAEQLADDMLDFLTAANARGWMIVADSPVAARMCEARNMHKIESPVFTTEIRGGE